MSRRKRRNQQPGSLSDGEPKRPADDPDSPASDGGEVRAPEADNARDGTQSQEPLGGGGRQCDDTPQPEGTADREDSSAESVKTHGWEQAPVKTRQRSFPAPGRIDEPVRIALTADACAEVSDHAKASLDEEVCGVLLGEVCRDDHGPWVLAKVAIRGTSAKQGGAHVTYTQETWSKIYEEKDRKYPKLDIVGWYHSHPGFGVEFSDMDKFIQQNFFSGPTQFALVVDPLGGDEAVCVNEDGDVRYVSRYWIGSKERKCRVPQSQSEVVDTGAVPAGLDKRLRSVEDRLQQLLQASEEDRATRYGFLLTIGCLVAAACITWIVMTAYWRLWLAPEPPQPFKYVSAPVDIDGEPVLLGIQTMSWKIPPKFQAEFVKQQRREFDAELKMVKEEIQAQIKAMEEAAKQQQEAAQKRQEAGEQNKKKEGSQP